MRLIRCTWDDGWVGKHVNAPGPDGDSESPRTRLPDVSDRIETRPFLYAVENGVLFGCWRRHPIGLCPEE